MTPTTLVKRTAALLLDIEGTTTPIAFVHSVLFTYARAHVREYLAAHRSLPEVQADITGLFEENAIDAGRGLVPRLFEGPRELMPLDELNDYVGWLIDHDRKTTPLKSLQGKIWCEGYRRGELRSQIFDDVPPAFRRWHEQAKKIFIYSSGSVLAQKLLFANTETGDLTPFINGYFDTNIGAKKDPRSYRRIAGELELAPAAILFISDVADELDAAASEGIQTLLCVRPGNPPQTPASIHTVTESFDSVLT